MEKCCGDGEESCREVLENIVLEKLEKNVGEKCCREVLWRGVAEKCCREVL